MKGKWLFILTIVMILSSLALILLFNGISLWIKAIPLVISLILMTLLWYSTIRTLDKVIYGFDLLNSQDTSNRLTKVGYRDADTVARLFNALMDRIKSERLKSEEKAHLLNLLIEVAPVGVALCDYDGRITSVNETFVRYASLPSIDFLNGKTPKMIPGELGSIISTIPRETQKTFRLSDTSVWRCYRLSFIDNGFKKEFFLLEKMTEEIIKAEKLAYKRAIRTMAHEVNNTIGVVIPILDLIREEITDPECQSAIDSTAQRCRFMAKFISDYAAVVKIPPPSLHHNSLNKLIGEMRLFLESMAGNKIKVIIEKTSGKDEAFIDVVQIEQVIVNIVKNSIESILSTGKKNGMIRLSLTSDPLSVTITDNGAGITAESSMNLFTPFFTTKRNGNGLGLMFVGETLRNHRCTFSLKTSETDGLTRFIINFPQKWEISHTEERF